MDLSVVDLLFGGTGICANWFDFGGYQTDGFENMCLRLLIATVGWQCNAEHLAHLAGLGKITRLCNTTGTQCIWKDIRHTQR